MTGDNLLPRRACKACKQARDREYNRNPATGDKRRARMRAWSAEYRQRPEVRERERQRRRSAEWKLYCKLRRCGLSREAAMAGLSP